MPSAPSTPVIEFQKQYALLRRRLADAGWISEGYVQNRGPGAGGPCYQWTRKVARKTITVALSPQQFHSLGAAIQNRRKLQETINEMEKLSRRILFGSLPDTRRHKSLPKKALGLI